MELSKFIKNFSEQFEETEITEFKPNTVFKNLDEWSSLTALSIIAVVDDEYSVKITGEDIKNATTIEDLFAIVTKKTA